MAHGVRSMTRPDPRTAAIAIAAGRPAGFDLPRYWAEQTDEARALNVLRSAHRRVESYAAALYSLSLLETMMEERRPGPRPGPLGGIAEGLLDLAHQMHQATVVMNASADARAVVAERQTKKKRPDRGERA